TNVDMTVRANLANEALGDGYVLRLEAGDDDLLVLRLKLLLLQRFRSWPPPLYLFQANLRFQTPRFDLEDGNFCPFRGLLPGVGRLLKIDERRDESLQNLDAIGIF